jgi:hypothetical protein
MAETTCFYCHPFAYQEFFRIYAQVMCSHSVLLYINDWLWFGRMTLRAPTSEAGHPAGLEKGHGLSLFVLNMKLWRGAMRRVKGYPPSEEMYITCIQSVLRRGCLRMRVFYSQVSAAAFNGAQKRRASTEKTLCHSAPDAHAE